MSDEVDLLHHGDRDIAENLVDLAVNVRLSEPPQWLQDVLVATVGDLATYPQPEAARAAIAERHRRPLDQVLPTSGGAEAFTLIARAFAPQHAVVVHPQFTEPEAALVAAGHRVDRVILTAAKGFRLAATDIPEPADLVMIGNPTNPTGVLHRAELLRALTRPGRTLVVDEAFMDSVPGERESLAAEQIPGLLVLRSLTKTWGIAGLRAGYVLGEAALISDLAKQQPPWSVSTPALAAMVACSAESAIREAAAAVPYMQEIRDRLVCGLTDLGYGVVANPQTPFVVVDTRVAGREPGWMRLALREAGFAVRRGESFPGLGPDWIRIAVRDDAVMRSFLAAVEALKVAV
ncbi:Rv2231c family pyridoxal phosphate-dependent protein CobC [Nakamurella antarctica]|uniref:Rv2231c family pyridoxal phosphate-dependent protein CobC n=1 Tax=Nakamurella antarctica TaxID=1902245 RepID=UPI0019D2AA5F|nr:Rv2231c family pyridoxal phosphate-dependent protein CobC [Nakamurella antarctica]